MERSFDARQIDEILNFVRSAQHDVLLTEEEDANQLVVRQAHPAEVKEECIRKFCSHCVGNVTAVSPVPSVKPENDKPGMHLLPALNAVGK